jgi:hypothetical protein
MMSKGEEPTVFEFPSSYSFYTSQPQDAGTIIPCESDTVVTQKLKAEVESQYYKKPVICFVTAE